MNNYRSGFVTLLGRPNVGKSTLINKLIGEKITITSPIAQTTRKKLKEASFIEAINISAKWCKDWRDDLLSEEVLADRISEIIKTNNGIRGFFAYALSDKDCFLLDKLPSSIVFKFNESGREVVEIVVKNLIMSSAQIIIHQRQKMLITS